MKPNKIKIHKIKSNPNNPRLIKDVRFKKLVKSIKDFPEMLKLRPIVVDEKNIILGGNMRHKACIEAGLKEIYVIQADELTEEQKKMQKFPMLQKRLNTIEKQIEELKK